MTPNRVGQGVREGGQFAVESRAEPDTALAADLLTFVDNPDPLYGECWEVPDDVDPDLAVNVERFPLEQVSWWAVTPADGDAWCHCGRCPREPRLLADDEDAYRCAALRIAHYAACMQRGDEFPPIQVLHDPDGQDWNGPRHLLVDAGHHRISAALLAGRTTIEADLYAADHAAALRAVQADGLPHIYRA